MKNVLLACVSHRGLEQECVVSAESVEAPLLKVQGIADIALGRNLCLTAALREASVHGYDTIVLLDDDMVFSAADVENLVKHSRKLKSAVSAVYALKDGSVAAKRYRHEAVVGKSWMSARWMTGLGLMAIPVQLLKDVSARSMQVDADGMVTVFTWSGPDNGQWVGEDYRLCLRLGGAILAPVPVGHLKRVSLKPDSGSVERIAEGKLP